ncbi:pyridine nucleotide-disulfide oxidoreductase [Gemmatimonas phototrophica]|uniref:Pyridine nucleotide-disulfide oxidoreductase n=1 Tax=Gemmatimonas phototrophica TaxID=1379270 RepID=A0A143BND3_9BACT|nr:pyridine nucleotide-disulfide oxidoreductase [Gemmatimonas phototrophica]
MHHSLTGTGTHLADPRPHVVIVGGGFAGLAAARTLADAPVRITLLDRTNHHLFQPLLYQVATAVLNPADISVPIRWLLRKQQNATVVMADVDRIDPADKTVSLDGGSVLLSFDFLLLAAGARHAYFGHPEWEQFAPGLKNIEDALEMRRRFLLSFEAAERASAVGERDALLTFVIVGGGPTGVELAGMIPEVTHHALKGEFRRIDPSKARVLLLEGGPRILPAFPEELSAQAQRDLEALGVEVRTNCVVTTVDADGVVAGGERIDAHTVFWGAGNQASPLAKQLGVPLDRAGRVSLNADLSVPGYEYIFCAGDVASTTTDDGKPVPAVAPAANQMGELVGRNIAHTVAGSSRETFRYFNKGDLATIGRHKAVAVIGGAKLRGLFAWLTWLFVHILYLVGMRNRLTVVVQWAYQYLTFQRGVRLITGTTVHRLLKASKAANDKRRAA